MANVVLWIVSLGELLQLRANILIELDFRFSIKDVNPLEQFQQTNKELTLNIYHSLFPKPPIALLFVIITTYSIICIIDVDLI